MEEEVIEKKQVKDEVTLKELILKIGELYRYILSKWVAILVFGLLGGALGYFYSVLNKPVYTASTTFVLEGADKGGGLGQYAGLASVAGIDLGGGGAGSSIFEGDNILELYKSRKMIEKTLLTEVVYQGRKQLLIDHYIAFNKLREGWDKKPELRNLQFKIDAKNQSPNFTRVQDSVLETIVKNIVTNYLNVAKPDKKLSIIKADIKAKDEVFAKNFDEQLVKNVNDFYVQTKTKKSIANIVIMQKKTDSVRSAMNGSIYTAAAIADATPNLNITRQIQRTAPVQRSQFSVEANKAILSELVKNLELSKISLLKETPLIQVIDVPILPLDKKFVSKLKGIVIGGFFGVFLTVLILISIRSFKSIFN